MIQSNGSLKSMFLIPFFTLLCDRGTDLGMESAELNRGYTHAFESTFESKSGLQEYLDSAALAAFAEGFLPTLSQRLVIDYFLY